jgi:hypothetical protein
MANGVAKQAKGGVRVCGHFAHNMWDSSVWQGVYVCLIVCSLGAMQAYRTGVLYFY